MKFEAVPQTTHTVGAGRRTNRATRPLAWLTTWPVIGLLALTMSAGALIADDEMGLAASGTGAGGDSVGSLPFTAPPPPAGTTGANAGEPGQVATTGPATPIFTLVGTQAELDLVIHDAQGTGSVTRVVLGNGLVRYEFYGRVTVWLDRSAFQSSFVSAQILIGASFQGALAKLRVDDVLKAKQILLAGSRDMRLHQLLNAGIVDLGLNWHALSPTGVHAILAVDAAPGNLIRVDQRD